MASNGKKENILTSWKEIAAYLDRDVRTCVRWEQRYGLPVHRLERDSKAKVFAYKDQIDEWLAERSALARSPAVCGSSGPTLVPALPGPFRPGRPGRRGLFPVLPGAGRSRRTGRFPHPGSDAHRDRREGTRAVAPRHAPARSREGETSTASVSRRRDAGADYVPVWPYVMIRDIDGDGRPEVLFSTQTISEDREGTLICFDDRGTELWRARPAGARVRRPALPPGIPHLRLQRR